MENKNYDFIKKMKKGECQPYHEGFLANDRVKNKQLDNIAKWLLNNDSFVLFQEKLYDNFYIYYAKKVRQYRSAIPRSLYANYSYND